MGWELRCTSCWYQDNGTIILRVGLRDQSTRSRRSGDTGGFALALGLQKFVARALPRWRTKGRRFFYRILYTSVVIVW